MTYDNKTMCPAYNLVPILLDDFIKINTSKITKTEFPSVLEKNHYINVSKLIINQNSDSWELDINKMLLEYDYLVHPVPQKYTLEQLESMLKDFDQPIVNNIINLDELIHKDILRDPIYIHDLRDYSHFAEWSHTCELVDYIFICGC